MWEFLDGRQKNGNPENLKKAVAPFVKIIKQKDAGQRGENISFEVLELIKTQIIAEAVFLVLDDRYEKILEMFKNGQ